MSIAEPLETSNDDGIVHLSEEETRALFDELVRERMGISGEEFKRRLAAGEYNEIGDDFANYPWLMPLIMFSQSVD